MDMKEPPFDILGSIHTVLEHARRSGLLITSTASEEMDFVSAAHNVCEWIHEELGD